MAVPPGSVRKPPAKARDGDGEVEKGDEIACAEAGMARKEKVAGVSKFNAFCDVEDIAREERSRRMRRRMESAGWPMSGERRTWI